MFYRCPFVGIAYQKGQRHAYEIQVLREKLLAQNDVVLDPEVNNSNNN